MKYHRNGSHWYLIPDKGDILHVYLETTNGVHEQILDRMVITSDLVKDTSLINQVSRDREDEISAHPACFQEEFEATLRQVIFNLGIYKYVK